MSFLTGNIDANYICNVNDFLSIRILFIAVR